MYLHASLRLIPGDKKKGAKPVIAFYVNSSILKSILNLTGIIYTAAVLRGSI